MIVNDLRAKLFELLYQACLDDIAYLKNAFSERKVFSYAIYCNGGFTAFGGAACS